MIERSTFRERLGLQLRRARKLIGLRQSDVAEALVPQVHIARVSEWERGYSAPSVEQLAQLAGMLDLSLDEVILFASGKATRKYLGMHSCQLCNRRSRIYDWLPDPVLCEPCQHRIKEQESRQQE